MNFIAQFKSLPGSTRRLMSFGIVVALLFGLPLFVWAIVSQRFLISQKAATGEPTCIPVPTCNVPEVTGQDGFLYCPTVDLKPGVNYCKRTPIPTCRPRPACLDSVPACKIMTPLEGWCGPTPRPTPTPRSGAECGFCGGIAGVQCQTGLFCQMRQPLVPDGSGICLKRDGTSRCTPPTPVPTCQPRPSCLDAILPCRIPEPISGWCKSPPPTPTPSPRCTSRPACLDAVPACKIPEPASGWCPPPTVRPFQILFKFQGVSDDSASYAKQGPNAAKVTAKFFSSKLNYALGYSTTPITADYAGNGVYALHFGVWSTNLPAGNDYAISLKGEKHIGIKFCSASGQTTHCTGAGNVTLPTAPLTKVNLDFTGIPLPPGDLQPQDGAVTTLGANSDLSKLLVLLAKPPSTLTSQDLVTGDLDYNGVIDVRDLFLLRQTLQTRYDEN